jgi:hypothetical protein
VRFDLQIDAEQGGVLYAPGGDFVRLPGGYQVRVLVDEEPDGELLSRAVPEESGVLRAQAGQLFIGDPYDVVPPVGANIPPGEYRAAVFRVEWPDAAADIAERVGARVGATWQRRHHALTRMSLVLLLVTAVVGLFALASELARFLMLLLALFWSAAIGLSLLPRIRRAREVERDEWAAWVRTHPEVLIVLRHAGPAGDYLRN